MNKTVKTYSIMAVGHQALNVQAKTEKEARKIACQRLGLQRLPNGSLVAWFW